jgi:hypothetical protein
MRPEHEIEDNPTMHPDHELRGRPPEKNLPRGHAPVRALTRAVVSGSILAGFFWIVLAAANVRIEVILAVLAPIWIGSITLLYSIHRARS